MCAQMCGKTLCTRTGARLAVACQRSVVPVLDCSDSPGADFEASEISRRARFRGARDSCYSTGVKILQAWVGCCRAHHSAPTPPGTSGARGSVFTSTVSDSSWSACCSGVVSGCFSSSGDTTERMSGGVRFIAVLDAEVPGDVGLPWPLAAGVVLLVPGSCSLPRHRMVSLKHTTGALALFASRRSVTVGSLAAGTPPEVGATVAAGAALSEV